MMHNRPAPSAKVVLEGESPSRVGNASNAFVLKLAAIFPEMAAFLLRLQDFGQPGSGVSKL